MLDHQPFDKRANNAATAPAFLSVWNVEAYYGESYIVQDVSFNVHEGEILALLGRNGAGKTSTLRAIARMPNPEIRKGEVWLDHKPLHNMTSYEAAQNGMALVPEDRRIIQGLTVEENLKLAQIAPPIGWSLERIYEVIDTDNDLVAASVVIKVNAARRTARRFRAANSRCLPSPARWPATSRCCCSTNPTKASRRSSCRKSPRR